MSQVKEEVVAVTEPTFQFKASMVTMMILELRQLDHQRFERELQQKVAAAPKLLQDTPIILSMEKLAAESGLSSADFSMLIEICRSQSLVPVAVKGASEAQTQLALSLGLATMPGFRKIHQRPEMDAAAQHGGEPDVAEQERADQEAENELADTAPGSFQSSKIIRQPVRSGQQVYAKDSDLIVLAPVSDGAEVLADGNIHIYAPLRGRAIAGIKSKGNGNIFCQSLEASLVSIGGVYMLDEDMRELYWQRSVRIYLKDENLHIEKL